MSSLRLAVGWGFVGVAALVIACGGGTASVPNDPNTDGGSSGTSGTSGGTSGTSGGTSGSTGKSCTTDTDCGAAGSGKLCGFLESQACAATGQCFDVGNNPTCAAFSPGCACDGSEINVACSPLPAGFSSKALRSMGECPKGGTDGGDGSCMTSQDCDKGKICGFPEKDACSAKGQCYPMPGAQCNAFSPGCACDGTTINIVCNGLPAATSPKPLLHAGMCP